MLQAMVARGDTGLDAGRGFFDWSALEAAAVRRDGSERLHALLDTLDRLRPGASPRCRTRDELPRPVSLPSCEDAHGVGQEPRDAVEGDAVRAGAERSGLADAAVRARGWSSALVVLFREKIATAPLNIDETYTCFPSGATARSSLRRAPRRSRTRPGACRKCSRPCQRAA